MIFFKHKISLLLFFCIFTIGYSQIPNFNLFPALKPLHVLDSKLDKISFAMGMRVLESNYDGPLIKLRKDGETNNESKDFGWAEDDVLDIKAINKWRGNSRVFVVKWYDQSGLGRDAIQLNPKRQPELRFMSFSVGSKLMPFFRGDGYNDHLLIDTPNGIQDLINNGREGTVLGIFYATKGRSQNSFGVLLKNFEEQRWQAHINWRNGRLYFDPGSCCAASRSFDNSNNYRWNMYTLMKSTDSVFVRIGGINKIKALNDSRKTTLRLNFTIGWANGNESQHHSTTAFNEFIMYNNSIEMSQIKEIEDNAITFWEIK